MDPNFGHKSRVTCILFYWGYFSHSARYPMTYEHLYPQFYQKETGQFLKEANPAYSWLNLSPPEINRTIVSNHGYVSAAHFSSSS